MFANPPLLRASASAEHKSESTYTMGYGKNNRRRGKVKVTRKTKNTLKFKSKLVGDHRLKAKWDHTKTTRQNYENLGLVENPNLVNANSRKALQEEEVEFIDISAENECSSRLVLQEPNLKKNPNHVSEEEMKYLRPLVKAYSDNYKKMALDIKMNNMQWTEAKLKRRCERLLRYDQ